MSDKGLNLLLRSCCDLGFLSWQPVDFSDCITAEDEEGTWAVKTAGAGQQRGLQALPVAGGLVVHWWGSGSVRLTLKATLLPTRRARDSLARL